VPFHRIELRANRRTGFVTGSFASFPKELRPPIRRGVVYRLRNEPTGIVPHPTNPGDFKLTLGGPYSRAFADAGILSSCARLLS
jgi:hypothetical protein